MSNSLIVNRNKHRPADIAFAFAGFGEHTIRIDCDQLETLLDLAEHGIAELFEAQRRVLGL